MSRFLWVLLFLGCFLRSSGEEPSEEVLLGVVKHYSVLAHAIYADCVAEAEKLEAAVRELTERPSAATLEAARKAWIAARKPYGQSEAFRYYAGPIDDDDGPEAAINAWPLDENFLESWPKTDGKGIIEDTVQFPELTIAVLERLNQREGEENVCCGFHAIEFLLWGRDSDENGPGNRSAEDYSTAPHASRRAEALRAITQMLVRDLKYVLSDWEPGKLGNYRASFEETPKLSLQRILTGMSLLSALELAGERMQVAYDTQEQEEEHSCFSDTTHLDILHNTQAVANLWLGSYESVSGKKITGPGIKSIAQVVDPTLTAKLDAKIMGSVAKAAALKPPFDQAIRGDDEKPERLALFELMISLEDQGDYLRMLGKKFGVVVPTDMPLDAEK